MLIDLTLNAITFPDWISETAVTIPLPGGRSLPIRWYGLAYIFGVILAFLHALRITHIRELWVPDGVTRGVDTVPGRQMLEDFAFYCLLGILIGGRAGSLILYDSPDTFWDIFKVWEGGMAFHGGFLGVCVAIWFTSRKYKISIWRWADMVAIGAPLGLFLGRIANFVNQELWGRPTEVPWAVVFPKKDWTPRHPSQIYEAVLEGLVIFLILWYMTRKTKALTRPGICAGLFVFLYGVFRTFVEFFREPDNIPQIHEYFTRGMLYSLPMIVAGSLITLWACRRQPVAPHFAKGETKGADVT
ncbi:MAG: prolipoprotein diacylglyceryl transferase [Hyphomonadaceae bacterium]|nr:prolipoprotein diacylglyceryl transferase [Hyphomonadaceae bacterium]MBC6412295.1 prolipoprotein diacylglyceryl transferase [Hyphomonadaceae bacterium]